MTFIWPVMLLSLLCLPLFIVFYLLIQRRRQRLLSSFNGFTDTHIPASHPGRRRHLPALLFLLGLGLLLFALARPKMIVNLPRIEGTVILAFDVSGSMAADDLQPNRMSAAKASASEFVQRQPPTVLIGIVAFSESGLAVQAPTNDRNAILDSINRLEPQKGTSLGYGILASLSTIIGESDALSASENEPTPTPEPIEKHNSAVIVLLSDGENTAPPDPYEAAYTAAEHGVRIHTIGIGSQAGADLKIDGYTVHTALNGTALEQIAGVTGGQYFRAENEADFQKIYDSLTPELVIKAEQMEVTSLFAGASILILLIGAGLMLVWFGRLP